MVGIPVEGFADAPKENFGNGVDSITPEEALKEGDEEDRKLVAWKPAEMAGEREELLNRLGEGPDDENKKGEVELNGFVAKLSKNLAFPFPEETARVAEDEAAVEPKVVAEFWKIVSAPNIPFAEIGKRDEVDEEPAPFAAGYNDECTGLETPGPWLEDAAATPVKE